MPLRDQRRNVFWTEGVVYIYFNVLNYSRNAREKLWIKNLSYLFCFQLCVSAISVFGSLICKRPDWPLVILSFLVAAYHFCVPPETGDYIVTLACSTLSVKFP